MATEKTADKLSDGMNMSTTHLQARPAVANTTFSTQRKDLRAKGRRLLEAVMFYRDGHKTFFGSDSFPWVAKVEAEWMTIRGELEAVMLRRREIPNFQ